MSRFSNPLTLISLIVTLLIFSNINICLADFGWTTVIDEDGVDGGHLTVEIWNTIPENEVNYAPQDGGTGPVADLDVDDVFIEWDEDRTHGSAMCFTFSGGYDAENPPYVQVSGEGATNWVVYRVTSPGELKKTNPDEINELHAISFPSGVDYYKIEKTDNLEEGQCVDPLDSITYTINYEADGYTDTNVVIVDILPEELTYNSAVPAPNNISGDGKTLTWEIGDFDYGNEQGSIDLTVDVSEYAEPGTSILNTCYIQGDSGLQIEDYESTDVCCEYTVIYVDANADPNGDGLSWETAFDDLQYAIDYVASEDCFDTIYVAAGEYKPTEDPNLNDANFVLINNVNIYGHFNDETDPNGRDLSNPAYESILQGEIESGYKVYHVVTADGITGALLDGFTVSGAHWEGIELNQADMSIANCEIRNNTEGGLQIHNSNVTVQDCKFTSNEGSTHLDLRDSVCDIYSCTFDGNNTTSNGIYSNSSILSVYNSSFSDNYYGLLSLYGSIDIADCVLSENANSGISSNVSNGSIRINRCSIYGSNNNQYSAGVAINGIGEMIEISNNCIYENRKGVFLDCDSGATPQIRSNTIADNTSIGIQSLGTISPDIQNCIIWNPDSDDLDNCTAAYSCIKDSFDVNDPNFSGSINSDPCFVDADNDDYHLDPNSLCINTGDPNGDYTGQADIDGEPRVMPEGDRIDMGADEFSCFPFCRDDYEEWAKVGYPLCWCYPRQCYGDADGLSVGKSSFWVSGVDLDVFNAAWSKSFEEIEGQTYNDIPLICADFDHYSSGKSSFRVAGFDLDILVANWNIVNGPDPNCFDPNCFD